MSRQRQWLVILAFALFLTIAHAAAAPTRRLRGEVDTQNTTENHQVETPIVENTTTLGDANGVHVLVDDSGTWHLVENATSSEMPSTNAPIATPPPTNHTNGEASSNGTASLTVHSPNKTDSSSSGIHSAQVDLKEKIDDKAPATASSTATAVHHRTPMAGFVLVGAMAILCVGIAAGIKRKQTQAVDHGQDH